MKRKILCFLGWHDYWVGQKEKFHNRDVSTAAVLSGVFFLTLSPLGTYLASFLFVFTIMLLWSFVFTEGIPLIETDYINGVCKHCLRETRALDKRRELEQRSQERILKKEAAIAQRTQEKRKRKEQREQEKRLRELEDQQYALLLEERASDTWKKRRQERGQDV